LNTYAHEASGVSPILCIRSPEKRCGKTRNLEVLSCLVHRPVHTANITVAALYRTIDHYRPTLLIDEADTIFVNGSNAQLRGVLNAGLYRSNAFLLRCIGKHQEPKLSSVWCPKAIALIGRLPSTLEDRSIVTSLRRRTADQAVEPFHYDQILEEMESIRRKSARWAADHLAPLKSAIPEVSDALNDRARDLWRPLQAIADAVGGGWPERARHTAGELSSDTPEPDPPANPHDVRSVVLKDKTQQEVTHVKTEETITAATEAPKSRTPRRAPATKTTAQSTPQKVSKADTKKRGAKKKTASARKTKATPPSAPREEARAGTKKAIVLELLRRKQGAAMSEIGKATGWQNHTIRGFISANVTKTMGRAVDSSKNEAGVRIYRIIQ
jgi:putative DNA primase/helicase